MVYSMGVSTQNQTAMEEQQPESERYLHYEDHGYVVIRNAFDPERMDNIVRIFQEQIVPSKQKFFRQNTFKYQKHRVNEYNNVLDSFLDIHNYNNFPDLRQAALDIYFDPEFLALVREVSGHPKHNLMQTMLFDVNTETWPHQDWWYLDSVPAGGLIAAWIALEDIQEAAGRFYVVPGSHKQIFHDDQLKISHDDWIAKVGEYVEANSDKVHAPALKKGDVLFWNSATVHGALATKDHSLTRKSLTAHYIPSHMMFGNLFLTKPWIKYSDYHGNNYYANQAEYNVRNFIIAEVKRHLYGRPTLLKLARKFQNKPLYD